MSKIVDLPTRKMEGQQQVIELLETLLARARDGKITEIAAAWITTDQMVETRITQSQNVFMLLGAIDILHRDVIENCVRPEHGHDHG